MNLGTGTRLEPNQRATTTEVFAGVPAASQNHWPSLEYGYWRRELAVARFLPGGFYYKTFMYPRAAWKHVFEPFIRQSAGLGKAPRDRDVDPYEQITRLRRAGGRRRHRGFQAARAARRGRG